jgi:hypothetical protein
MRSPYRFGPEFHANGIHDPEHGLEAGIAILRQALVEALALESGFVGDLLHTSRRVPTARWENRSQVQTSQHKGRPPMINEGSAKKIQ